MPAVVNDDPWTPQATYAGGQHAIAESQTADFSKYRTACPSKPAIIGGACALMLEGSGCSSAHGVASLCSSTYLRTPYPTGPDRRWMRILLVEFQWVLYSVLPRYGAKRPILGVGLSCLIQL